MPLIPFFTMAYLSRRPDTFYLRLLLLPLVIFLAFGTYFRFVYTDPTLSTLNWGQGENSVRSHFPGQSAT